MIILEKHVKYLDVKNLPYNDGYPDIKQRKILQEEIENQYRIKLHKHKLKLR
jgi:hypothetical protein